MTKIRDLTRSQNIQSSKRSDHASRRIALNHKGIPQANLLEILREPVQTVQQLAVTQETNRLLGNRYLQRAMIETKEQEDIPASGSITSVKDQIDNLWNKFENGDLYRVIDIFIKINIFPRYYAFIKVNVGRKISTELKAPLHPGELDETLQEFMNNKGSELTSRLAAASDQDIISSKIKSIYGKYMGDLCLLDWLAELPQRQQKLRQTSEPECREIMIFGFKKLHEELIEGVEDVHGLTWDPNIWSTSDFAQWMVSELLDYIPYVGDIASNTWDLLCAAEGSAAKSEFDPQGYLDRVEHASLIHFDLGFRELTKSCREKDKEYKQASRLVAWRHIKTADRMPRILSFLTTGEEFIENDVELYDQFAKLEAEICKSGKWNIWHPAISQDEIRQRPGVQFTPEIGACRDNNEITIGDDIPQYISLARESGQPIDEKTHKYMEKSTDFDFSSVRVHTSPEADALNRQLNAKAFTTGQDIFFRDGAYQPHTIEGQELIAHELTHVVQQASGAVGGGSGKMTVNPPGDRFEQEADAVAKTVVSEINSPSLQRQAPDEEEEELQTKAIQRQELPEEEEELVQRQELEEDEEELAE